MIINLGDAPFKAFIKVTYPNGTCTVSLGDKSFTHNGGGTHTFTVNQKGTWTVKATSAVTTESTSVSISFYKQIAVVNLRCVLWLYNGGNEYSGTTGGWNSYGLKALDTNLSTAPTLSKGASSMTATLSKIGEGVQGNSGVVRPNNAINLTNVKTLIFNLSASTGGLYNWGNIVAYNPNLTVIGDHCDNAAAKKIFSGYEKYDFPVADYTLDVSGLSGNYYIGVFLYNAASSAQMKFVINSIGMQ